MITNPTLGEAKRLAHQSDVMQRPSQFDACVLDVFDMHCAACAVLIEGALIAADGVSRARVHYATQRARVTFDPSLTSVEKLLKRIEYLGYTADAGAGVDRSDIARRQRHRHIWAFGLSTFCAMQVMMLTLPRFLAGADMEPELAPLLDWAAFALLLPVIGWTARPFYRGASASSGCGDRAWIRRLRWVLHRLSRGQCGIFWGAPGCCISTP